MMDDFPDSAAIEAALLACGSPPDRFHLDVRDTVASSNSTLLELAELGAPSGTVLLARQQSAGRGRNARRWFSASGQSLTFSLLWRFAPGTSPAGLSLAAGLALHRALDQLARPEKETFGGTAPSVPGSALRLKWPNDVLFDGKKLAGILVELVPGAAHVAVIGIGLNRALPDDLPSEVAASAAAWPLADPPQTLLAAILCALDTVLTQFAASGFAALKSDWLAVHAWQDAPISVHSAFAPTRHGLCRGVDDDGALRVEFDGAVERILSADLSLRRL